LPVQSWQGVLLPGDEFSFASYASLASDGRTAVFGLQRASSVEIGILADLGQGVLDFVAVRSDGKPSFAGNSTSATLDADGRKAAFRSEAADLVTGDANLLPDIFVRDFAANETMLVSQGFDGAQATSFSFLPIISANGRVVVFSSWADNLVPNDFNHAGDIFAADLPVRPFSDSDGDKLDDLWELSNFGNLLRDGSGDYDEDGASEAAEAMAGTSPINDLSACRATAKVESGSLVISWTTEPDRTYRLQSRDAIGTAWQPLGEGVPGDGNHTSRALPVPEAGQQFYRVVLE
jgi:hypothetical protein